MPEKASKKTPRKRSPSKSKAAKKTPTTARKKSKKTTSSKKKSSSSSAPKSIPLESSIAEIPEVEEVHVSESTVDQVVDWLVKDGSTDEEIRNRRHGLEDAEVEAALVRAKAKLWKAADFDRALEVGALINRFKHLYALAVAADELAPAIRASVELGKLLAAYPRLNGLEQPKTPESSPETRGALEVIEAHLRPLELAPEDYPVEDLARVAADQIRALRARIELSLE